MNCAVVDIFSGQQRQDLTMFIQEDVVRFDVPGRQKKPLTVLIVSLSVMLKHQKYTLYKSGHTFRTPFDIIFIIRFSSIIFW